MTGLDISTLELTVLGEDTEEDEDHWSCWDCCFDICGNGGYYIGEDTTPSSDISCEVCLLMDKLDDFTPTPCKHCGSEAWAISKYDADRTWTPAQ